MKNKNDIIVWFRNSVRDGKGRPYLLDDEQAAAVLDSHKNTLVSARAGAGKTHTLVAKIIYMIAELQYKPNEIMAFVFNKKAAQEINDRVSQARVNGQVVMQEGVTIARTFHSFALNIVTKMDGRGSFGNILMDGGANADTDSRRSLYIQDIISRLRSTDVDVRNGVHDYFRDEAGKINGNRFRSPEEYYRTIRNHAHLTLDGRSVKSFSEKIIADFFFEHGVKYRYEPEYYPRSFIKHGLHYSEYEDNLQRFDLIKGDFYLPNQRIVWEHWAINGAERQAEIDHINETGVIGDYDHYLMKKEWKRWFYSKVWLNKAAHYHQNVWYGEDFTKLVESYRPSEQSREDFEAVLTQKCRENGIRLRRYSHEELVSRAWEKQVKMFTKMVVQFIDRTQQKFYDDFEKLIDIVAQEPSVSDEQARIKVFHKIGIEVYKEYLKRLALRRRNGLMYVSKDNERKYFSDYGTDFSLLLQRSKDVLGSDSAKEMLQENNVKAILVDEYQDFSRLFYDNLIALRAIFPHSKLFCVGDDWQAINRFAGSDDEYFVHFDTYFPEDTSRLLISSNYRSAPEIVMNANHMMQKLIQASESDFAKAARNNVGSAIIKDIDLSKVSIDDMPDTMRNRAELYRYIVTISRLIIKHKNDDRILVLHRNNKMLIHFSVWGVMRYMVRDYVTNVLKAMTKLQFDKKIKFLDEESGIMTAHRSKGLEGDTVILLEVDPKTFPSADGRGALFEIFGDTVETHWKDEVRLYYVALTRAKKNLYVLWGSYQHAPEQIPEFIEALEPTQG